MDEEKRRRRALEAGREMLETYKLKHSNNKKLSKSLEQASDDESHHDETQNQSLDPRSMSINESNFSRDITYSSVSMSEGEGDGDLEGLAGRVTELEEMLQGKEAVVEALHAEIDHLRADGSSPTSSHSQNSNIPYKDIIVTYHTKLQEFERAVNQRDHLIEDLTTSLQQALASRDALLAQITVLNATQLECSNGESTFDGKISALENALSNQKELASELASQLEQAQQNVKRLEVEKETQNTELSNYKDQIQSLNEKIRADSAVVDENDACSALQLQKQYEEQVDKIKKDMKTILDKFASETKASNLKHEEEKQELVNKHEVVLNQLKEQNKNLEVRHAKEMSVLQTQMSNYKRTIESLKLDLVTRKETHNKEKELLTEQIKLHKLQLEEMTTKYVTSASVLDSKESIERSLEQALNEATSLRSKNESLKFKLNDLTSRYSAAMSLVESNQMHERTLSNKIFTLEKSLSRLSGISFTELDETAYQTIDEVALQFEITKQRLDEKAALEQKLMEKINDLEELVSKTKSDLESANLAKESYEKQIKDMRNTCDRMKLEMNSSSHDQQLQRTITDDVDHELRRMVSEEFEQEISELRKTIEKRDEETSKYMKKLEELSEANRKLIDESEKLKTGLATAYAQCAIVEEKLDQTLRYGENSKLDDSSMQQQTLLDQTVSSNASSLDLEELLHKQSNFNKVLKKLESCHEQIREYEKERSQLLREIEEKVKEKEELLAQSQCKEKQHREEIKAIKMEATAESQKFGQLLASFEEGNEGLKALRIELEEKHAKEMEELRTYFEQKCLQMEKQYSEEIFSQQSKKMSDNDSEIDELTEDLYAGGGGTVECLTGAGGGGDAAAIMGSNKEAKHESSYSKGASEERITKIAAEYEEKLESLRKQLQEVKEKSGRTVLLKAVNQALLTVEPDSDENWPTELLELRNKFTSNTKRELQVLKERHVLEIRRLKENYNQTINNLQEEIRKFKEETHESLESNLIKERDTLHKTCATLKGLVGQLIDYFADCEEELNSTLISEVFRKQFPISHGGTNATVDDAKIKRVHFAPQSIEIASIVGSDSSSLLDLISGEKDITKILKNELEACMKRLRADSAKILNTSFSDSESWSTGISDNASDKLLETEKLLAAYQEENECLRVKVIELQQRLLNAESKKEVVSEGYGEHADKSLVEEEQDEDFSQLQDRAKSVVMNGSNDTSYLLQLIDELCKHADKSLDDMRREKEDLQHQIEAADKQLRSTRRFQEEQAVERETERDEASKVIQQLQEKLRDKNRDRLELAEQSPLSLTSTSTGSSTLQQCDESEIDVSQVETLKLQLANEESRRNDAENELKAAVEKVWELRDCIQELELQLKEKEDREEILNSQTEQLKEVINAQIKNQQDLVQELELVKSGCGDNHVHSDHIGQLQEELRKHKLSSEQLKANSSALRQLKLELRDLQSQLSRKTREIESLHVCGSSLSLSQPSEDVSIRDQIDATRCPTPDDPTSPPVLPLDNVLKLKDNLLKHFRAEDVALKRLKDLDLQLSGLQRQNEELLAEQEILQQTTSEQLFQIEKLRARLEQQKQNAPFAQRQATSRLESQLYETNERLELTERALADKEIELNETRSQLERVSRILAEKENEIVNVVQSEGGAIKKLKDRLHILEEENTLFQAKLSIQDKPQTNLPLVIDTMLAEKNAEIDRLREQLAMREKQLEAYLSLDEHQLRDILCHQQHDIPKNSARTLSDILSINSECEELSEVREAPNYTRTQNMSNFKMPAQQHSILLKRDVVDHSQAITETPKVPRLELDPDSQCQDDSPTKQTSKEMRSLQVDFDKLPVPSLSPSESRENSDISESANDYVCPRHGKMNTTTNESVHNDLETTVLQQRVQELETNLDELKEELATKNTILEQREAELLEIHNNLDHLHENINSLNQDRLFYKTEYEKSKSNEEKIQMDLQVVENVLMKRTEELEDLRQKIQELQNNASEKLEEMTNLKAIITEKDKTIEALQARSVEINSESKELYEYRCKLDAYQQQIAKCQSEIQRLNDSLNSRDRMISKLEEMARRSSLSGDSSPSEKDQEIFHLQEYLKEKDKVIRQMSDDSKSLHRALETIQNKMKESGNVVELRRKLKEERKHNVELTEQLAKLRTELEMLGSAVVGGSVIRRNEEDNDIAEMVQRELNLSARLDQQLLNVIDSESDDVLKKCGDLKQANKVIEELNRLKDDLDIDREMLKSQIAEYEGRIMQLKADIEEDATRITRLEEELSKERHVIRSLQLQLHKEKDSAEDAKRKDTELIKQLNIKLHEALEIRDRLMMEKKNLEVFNSMRDQNGSTEAQEEIRKEVLALAEKLGVEKRKCEDVQEALKKLENEKFSLQQQVQASESEIEKLTKSVEVESLAKDQLKMDLCRAKEELKTKTKECDWHKSILKTVSDAEEKRKQQRGSEHSELKTLRRDLKNTQEILMDFEADVKTMKEQLSESAERESELTHCIKFLTDKETELTEQLTAAKSEDKKLRDIIADQQSELKILMRREIELADELKREMLSPDKNCSPSKILQRVKRLNANIDRLSQDKVHLYEKVERLRDENERYLDQIRFLETQLLQKGKSQSSAMPTRNDSEERLQHFYGKYLRLESRRKALIYQKTYLLCIVAGYQHVQENTLTFLATLTQEQRMIARRGPHRRNPRVRFRSTVFLLISILRMKWFVLRWRTGRRVGANVVLGSIERQTIPSTAMLPRQARSTSSGHSPPVKETPRTVANGISTFSHQPYYRRFANIQQNLHLGVPEQGFDNCKSD